MKLLILGDKLIESSTNYRGTYRESLSYRDDLPEAHALNQAFLHFCNLVNEDGVVERLEDAQVLTRLINQFRSDTKFEVIQIAPVCNDFQKPISTEFLGYDLSTGHYSLLAWGLDLMRYRPNNDDYNPDLNKLVPFLKLIKAHFQPKLNHYGLFDSLNDAKFCLECMLAAQAIQQNLWENDETVFEVISLWKVTDKE